MIFTCTDYTTLPVPFFPQTRKGVERSYKVDTFAKQIKRYLEYLQREATISLSDARMNTDCWYYIIEKFFNNYEKHCQLKLVCRLFYSIVDKQTRQFYKQIEGRICFQKERGYEIYRNYFMDVDLGENQFGWIVPLKDILDKDITSSHNFYTVCLGHKITLSFSFSYSLGGGFSSNSDDTGYIGKVFFIRNEIRFQNQRDSLIVKYSVDFIRTDYSRQIHCFATKYNSSLCVPFDNSFLTCFSTMKHRKYIMIVVTIDIKTLDFIVK